MDRFKWIGLGVLAAGVYLFFATTSLAASEIANQGKVVEVRDSRVKIEYEGQYAPNIGDPVEIGFKLGEDFIPVEGEWKIVEVSPPFVWVQAKGTGAGTPAIDYLAIIHSHNPLKKTDLAPLKEKLIKAREELNETDVTRVLEKESGAIPCEAGNVDWDGRRLLMTTTGHGNCMVKIAEEEMEDFRVTAKVATGDGPNFTVGLFYGVDTEPGSVFFVLMNTFSVRTLEIFQTQVGRGIKKIVSTLPPGSNQSMDHLEMIKYKKQYNFFFNGNMVADWTDTVSRKGEVRLTTGSIGSPVMGSFQDFKVYKLE